MARIVEIHPVSVICLILGLYCFVNGLRDIGCETIATGLCLILGALAVTLGVAIQLGRVRVKETNLFPATQPKERVSQGSPAPFGLSAPLTPHRPTENILVRSLSRHYVYRVIRRGFIRKRDSFSEAL